ncbi:MaoC family dehydratase N-terminal domain-containing protein [Caulobacter sp. KR2-114]|uniref:MaoC family dehydratase N-terminal domain-containing protein n=1 Tax=Caulobacter sp. KR2-114 TaxID=3400912 RepID=UPI003C0208B8
MAIDAHRHIGVVSEPRVVLVERGLLRFFAKATGETNPIYFDVEAARSAGHPDILAPPTYVFSLQLSAPAKAGDVFDPVGGLGVDMARVLHGEEAFAYHHPIHAGDQLELVTTTTDIYDRKGGALQFVVQETRVTNGAGAVCVEARQVTVVRNG